MQEEFDALLKNKTWELVPSKPTHNIVGNKWIFRIKRKADGTIDRYKARHVAKGFTQRPGIDVLSTFSPVVKPITIRVVLTLALQHGWTLHQLDINNAFLQGNLEDEVYMNPPQGFVNTDYPNHVCHLRKVMAPHAWYQELKTFLMTFGFKRSHSDSSLFIYRSMGNIIFLLVNVDDIVSTSSNLQSIH